MTSAALESRTAVEAVKMYISANWDRTIVPSPKASDTEIGLPHPGTVPGLVDGLRQIFYWDIYFTNLGLLRSGRIEQAIHNVENCFDMIDKFSFVPNPASMGCAKSKRSQIPFTALMVRDIFEITTDTTWLARSLPFLIKEYDFWQKHRSTPIGLNRYFHGMSSKDFGWKFEQIKGRLNLYHDVLDPEAQARIVNNHVAECESGWDYTSRFDHRCADFAPVDLNTNLYLYEVIIGEYSALLRLDDVDRWNERARQRAALIQQFCWDNTRGWFSDYDYVHHSFGSLVTAASFAPLYAGLATPDQAQRSVGLLARLEQPFGISATERVEAERPYQWNYPNGWAPLHWMAIAGLLRAGFREDALRIAQKFVDLTTGIFHRSGTLWEKNNVVAGSIDVADEYVMPPQLGWTAGVFLWAEELLQKNSATAGRVSVSRTMIIAEPYVDWDLKWRDRGVWPAKWIGHPQVSGSDVAVVAYRRKLTMKQTLTMRFHVTADERYELFIDGERVGRGSERGDPQHWFYETYDCVIPAGEHMIVARTWHLGHEGPSPCAQMSVRPGFLLDAEGEAHELLSTGVAAWECKKLGGYEFAWPYPTELPFTGARVRMRGREMDWGVESGVGDDWVSVRVIGRAVNASMAEEQPTNVWQLCPATLPPMLAQEVSAGSCRHVAEVPGDATESIAVQQANHLPAEAVAWDALAHRRSPLTIPPRTMRRVILDLENYFCGYVELIVSGGAGAVIRISWAESLYEVVLANAGGYHAPRKGNRGEVEGKYFRGFSDTFEPDGGEHRRFQPLWWSAGRYLEVFVSTGTAPLTFESLCIEETRYPIQWRGDFDASDQRLPALLPVLKRALEMCSHDIYMDCPFYEQLMYVGDTRLEALQTYAMTSDDRLPRKALVLFDASRRLSGLTQSRYPSRVTQVIPPFSLWWVAMVHDYLMWRDDVDFVKARMPGVRAVLEAFHGCVNRDGLVQRTAGWNFMDWVPGWSRGVPPDGERGVSAAINLQTVMVLRQATELEDVVGEIELAKRNRSRADRIAQAVQTVFWDEERGLFADDIPHTHFSEHAQCLALLGEVVTGAQRKRVIEGLFSASDLHRATIYFSHYLFETCRATGQMQALFDRLGFWFDLQARDLKTTIETPEPARSDCHAWSAHPQYHYLASILGIRPAAPGFAQVRIEPQLGPLRWAKGCLPHPKGMITVELVIRDGRLVSMIDLPPDLPGELIVFGKSIALAAGMGRITHEISWQEGNDD